ncbi:hypothetical protein P5G51_000875 [Virgibacillus sp. 179-BFC.A HS]|uniref:Lipoprotein n=1 Tax=Tigheibacillus jepli TaxID=3035914 RepID=A0ABU5CCV1_9BACI|nr:hypothetical protein [Virgibacillus sp. 179-BFC.A HS]MDY0404151.1 hypothetical protein [Virgibacillus sp. 179-BFC.A HS]
MKKIILLLIGCTLMLAACANDQQDKSKGENEKSPATQQADDNADDGAAENETDSKPQEKNDTTSDDENDGATENETNSQPEVKKDAASKRENTVEDVTTMPEYSVIKDQIAIDDYQLDVVEDNAHKRIIILKNKDTKHKEYKSIFIKDSGRLKIIQFHDNGLIYNKQIK